MMASLNAGIFEAVGEPLEEADVEKLGLEA